MGKRSNFPRRKHDAYATPHHGMVSVVPFLQAEGIRTFAEPCAGNGDLVDHLSCYQFRCVHAGDILHGDDAFSHHDFPGADAIITNPPWTRALMHPLIVHFMAILPTWLLFDADWAHTKQAAPFLRHCSHIVSAGRIKWIPGSKHTGKDNAAWYRFERRHVDGPRFFGKDCFIREMEDAA
jgi:hypothetical protein